MPLSDSEVPVNPKAEWSGWVLAVFFAAALGCLWGHWGWSDPSAAHPASPIASTSPAPAGVHREPIPVVQQESIDDWLSLKPADGVASEGSAAETVRVAQAEPRKLPSVTPSQEESLGSAKRVESAVSVPATGQQQPVAPQQGLARPVETRAPKAQLLPPTPAIDDLPAPRTSTPSPLPAAPPSEQQSGSTPPLSYRNYFNADLPLVAEIPAPVVHRRR